MSFSGLRVLSLETRKASEIEKLIVRQEGDALVVPSVQERELQQHEALDHFAEDLHAGVFDMVIFMTGVGLAFARDVYEARGMTERFAAGLRRVTIVSRGPKPVAILRQLQVPIHVLVPEPNTWREIAQAVAVRQERRIAVQEYGRPNAAMNQALEALGATVTPIAIYRWELPADTGPLRRAAHLLANREIDVVLFTSSIQLDHLLQIAEEEGIEPRLREAFYSRTVIASIGPVMNDSLASHGFAPDIVPKTPKMGALVKAAAEEAGTVLRRKRGAGGNLS